VVNVPKPDDGALLGADTLRFYVEALTALNDAGVPYLVGGAFAFAHYTGIQRCTKDFDVFLLPDDCARAVKLFTRMGWETEEPPPLWLAKARRGDDYVDIIYGSGNGLTVVDRDWFVHARDAAIFGMPVKLCPPEEMIWSKAFIQERERFDGADVVHLLHDCASTLDWPRLVERFGPHWRVLLTHLITFAFVYPAERHLLPRWLVDAWTVRLASDGWDDETETQGIAFGTLLSRGAYSVDVARRGYRDVRVLAGLLNEGEAEKQG
jgi:hypothetical protein